MPNDGEILSLAGGLAGYANAPTLAKKVATGAGALAIDLLNAAQKVILGTANKTLTMRVRFKVTNTITGAAIMSAIDVLVICGAVPVVVPQAVYVPILSGALVSVASVASAGGTIQAQTTNPGGVALEMVATAEVDA